QVDPLGDRCRRGLALDGLAHALEPFVKLGVGHQLEGREGTALHALVVGLQARIDLLLDRLAPHELEDARPQRGTTPATPLCTTVPRTGSTRGSRASSMARADGKNR